jgi:REP element-mobilizing transposase RayT
VGLLKLIRDKRERDWRPSPAERRQGFRGWYQRGYLPHFDAPGVTQFVTFQLYDSFPVRRHPEFESILNERESSIKRRKLEAWLDRGNGHCWLGQSHIAEIIETILLRRNGQDYELDGWIIMPNHVHLVVEVWEFPLAKLMNLWKGRSSRDANRALGRRGHFWQEDYFDTLIRDESHLERAIRYTEQNAVRASLVKTAQEWRWCSARHRDEYGRLP